MSILYPVATTAEAALHAPCGYAAREREAKSLSVEGAVVAIVTEPVGPAFASRQAALDAYPGADESGWRQLVPVAPTAAKAPAPVKPVYSGGRRWPEPPARDELLWRLSVSYWRIGAAADAREPLAPARKVRREEAGRALKGGDLNALARQPLRAVRPQQPLDTGLFEVRRPEAPDILIPDE